MHRMFLCRTSVLAALFIALAASPVFAIDISNVTITDIKSDSATISWKTDGETDGSVNYGLDSSVGIVRDAAFDKTAHLLTIENLDPVTTYYFRVVSSDKGGNKAATAGFVFTTKDDQHAQANKAIKEVKKVTDPEELKRVVDEVQQQAQDIIRPPSIIGSPKVEAGATEATISWTSDRSSNSMVQFSQDGDFQGGSYDGAQGNSGESTTRHSVTLTGLNPSTLYHFQVSSSDTLGLKGISEDDTFRTKSILPTIQNFKVSRIQETSANVSWSTGDVKAKGRIEYKNMRTKVARSVGDPVFTTSHNIQVTGLEFGTRYQATVFSTNEAGDETAGKPFIFITVRDVIPPQISKVTNESTLYPSEDTKVQTIITWQTDEPANCTVSYTQGLVHDENNQGDSLPTETNPLTDHTQVIVGFAPATVYKFWVVCADPSGNESKSDDFVLITPIKEKNIIDIILENFQGTFGWVNKIGK
jgi:hypothetical protein